MPTQSTDLVMVKEVAQRLRLGLTKVYDLAHKGEIRAYKMDGAVRVDPASVDEYLERSRMGPKAEPDPDPKTIPLEVSRGKTRKGSGRG